MTTVTVIAIVDASRLSYQVSNPIGGVANINSEKRRKTNEQ
jgi:hypothetical protein